MSSGQRIPLTEATALANRLVALLAPRCARIQVAGSIRRHSDTIGDVEIVCIPIASAEERVTWVDMFDGETVERVETNLLDEFCDRMLAEGEFKKRPDVRGRTAWGSSNKWGVYEGFAFDIYSATSATWGATLTIRTGCALFSKKLVTKREFGGFCPSNLHFKEWRVWHGDEVLETPEERDVFATLGIEMMAPEQRTSEASPRILRLA